jgi:hypothetical protein
VDLRPDCPLPWTSISIPDYSEKQSFTEGDKVSCGNWLSLFYHYKRGVDYSAWQKRGDRPIIFCNTEVRKARFKHLSTAG